MRPQLYVVSNAKGTPHAFLVDGNRIFTGKDKDGRTRTHYSRGLNMGPHSAGEILVVEEKGTIIYPWPAVVQMHKAMKEIDLHDRRLTEQTAKVLLSLSTAYLNVTVNDAKGTYTIGKPLLEGVAHGWCHWKLLSAWCWGKWLADGDKPAAMHTDLRRMGYKKNAPAFRKMMGRMGFVTHTKPSQSQQTENQ
jgi:hypothetical protein